MQKTGNTITRHAHLRRMAPLALALAVLGGALQRAQGETTNTAGTIESNMPLMPVFDDTPDWFPACGLKYDYVTGGTVSGAICSRIRQPDNPNLPVGYWITQAELGVGGYKIQFGVNRGEFGMRGDSERAGGAVKLSFMHTWREANNFISGEDYVGLEFQLRVRLFNMTAGVYLPLEREGEELLQYSWSAGVGF